MHPHAASLPAPLGDEAASVLSVLAAAGEDTGVKLNALATATGLPTGHVGRHLRTLERERLARYAAGAWQPTNRGVRVGLDVTEPALAAA